MHSQIFFSYYGSAGVPKPKSITLFKSFSVVINTILSYCHVYDLPLDCTYMRFGYCVVGFF